MKHGLLIAMVAVTLNTAFGQGLILNKDKFEKTEKWEPTEEYGYTLTNLPAKVSYRDYAPLVNHQGDEATCVGYAVAYGQLTTQQNVKMGVTNEMEKVCRAMDPHFIYALIKDANDSWCQKGSSMSDAMEVMTHYGCKPFVWDPWLSCDDFNAFNDMSLAIASNYRVSEYYAIAKDKDFIKTVKLALAEKLIVSVGVQLTESFVSGTAVKLGNWSPKAGESFIGGHAMCVVGYDNARNGGSFEVMNSYGSEYGDKGFVWIKYADFNALVSEAYIIGVDGFQKGDCSYGDCANTFSRYKFKNGDVYEGLIKNNYPDVFGSFVYANGDFYVGDFAEGRKNGSGIYYDHTQEIYFQTYFDKDVLIESKEIQGFSSEASKAKTTQLLNVLQSTKKGKVVTEDSPEYKKLMENLDVPEKGLVIELKTK